MSLARRNLLQDQTRLLLSVVGVALAVMLVILLNGLRAGMDRQVSAYLDHAPGPLVVAQEGVTNLLGATSVLPPGAAVAVRETEGVARAVPILSQFVILDLHGKKQPVYLVGYDLALGGGPWRMAEGRAPEADDGVVIDRVLAQRHNLVLEDRLTLMGRSFTIAGLSAGTTSWMTGFIFVPKGGVEALLRAPDATSFVLVTPQEGVTLDDIRGRLRAIAGIEVLLKDEMIANDLRLFARVFSAPIRLMAGIALLVGILAVGLVIYTATVERQREYGTLKAIGARNGLLYRVVLIQALIAATTGALLGVGLAWSAGWLIVRLRPQFLVILAPRALAVALLAGLLMAAIAALVPARAVARLAPAEVFRR